jgi:CheY-like chemotaxis protein
VHRACTILYIEDNSSNLVLVEMLLAQCPHITLVSATNGSEGLQQALQHVPHLILLDLQLPDMSGEDVLHQVRASPALAHIPVVMLSANALTATIDHLHAAGANAYLTKPLDVKLFFSTLNRFLS